MTSQDICEANTMADKTPEQLRKEQILATKKTVTIIVLVLSTLAFSVGLFLYLTKDIYNKPAATALLDTLYVIAIMYGVAGFLESNSREQALSDTIFPLMLLMVNAFAFGGAGLSPTDPGELAMMHRLAGAMWAGVLIVCCMGEEVDFSPLAFWLGGLGITALIRGNFGVIQADLGIPIGVLSPMSQLGQVLATPGASTQMTYNTAVLALFGSAILILMIDSLISIVRGATMWGNIASFVSFWGIYLMVRAVTPLGVEVASIGGFVVACLVASVAYNGYGDVEESHWWGIKLSEDLTLMVPFDAVLADVLSLGAIAALSGKVP